MSLQPFEPYGSVWLGDLLWATARTTVGGPVERRAWAADLLALPEFAPAADETSGARIAPDAEEAATQEPEPDELAELREPLAGDARAAATRSVPYGIVSRQREEGRLGERRWLKEALPLSDVSEAQIAARPSFQPLFHPRTTRALLSTALSTRRAEGDIDFDRVLELATQLRPLTALPRRPIATLRLGIQLLIDRGVGMWPFHDDQRRLERSILAVAGRDRVETLYFADSPLRGSGPAGRDTWRGYTPPAAGTPAVVLTDLGLARRHRPDIGATEDEWLRFAKLLRGTECPVLAILPYGQRRWPAPLRRAFAMLPWDRGTSVSLVRRLLGHGLEVSSVL